MAGVVRASVTGWDFHNFHVQQDISGGSFINAESILVAAGNPEPANNVTQTVTGEASETAYPFGLLENVGISQSKQLQRVFEIGSSRSYFVPGRVMGSLSLGRIMYHGPSMLRILYAYYNFPAANNFAQPLLPNTGSADMTAIKAAPGYDDIFLNLGSDLFNYPTGLVLYFRDQADTDVAGIYLTSCYMMGHQFSISSGSILVMEGSSLQYDRMIPVKLNITPATQGNQLGI